jgi:phytoene dehydrogenase-like protein
VTDAYDAVVVGAGPNGLVAANVLADAGWSVLVLEANAEPGGAVRTAEVTAPGFRNDLFSAFYPLGAASPVLQRLDLHEHGLHWVHAPAVVANPRPDAPAAVLYRDVERTAAALDLDAPGDGAAWHGLYERWTDIGRPFLESLLSPFPPVRGAARLAARLGPRGLLPFARFTMLPVRRLIDEELDGEAGALLLAGNALHADLTPESPPSALLGWLLAMLGHDVGFPVPAGGADRIPAALVARLQARGGELRCSARVDKVVLERGRAVGVEVDGVAVRARRAVLAATDAGKLYRDLVGFDSLPAQLVTRLEGVQHGSATVKVDWALSSPIPWTDPTVAPAGTVHLADSVDELSLTAAEIARDLIPARPFLLIGQMTTSDPTRSPAGTESAWAYTHLPARPAGDAGGTLDTGDAGAVLDGMVERMEARIEAYAPGFRDRVLARHVQGPDDLERHNANLVDGDIGGGTSQLHQQLVFRPVSGLGRAETPVRGLFLASASAHPGGAVHGACGANAARAALAHHRARRVLVAVGAVGAAAIVGRHPTGQGGTIGPPR